MASTTKQAPKKRGQLYQNDKKYLYERRNVDDVFARSVIASLLNLLNNRLRYTQIWDNGNPEEYYEDVVTVPFLYQMGNSSERFVQDNYMFFKDVCNEYPNMIDGSFDGLPRGAINMTSMSIDASAITNMYVMGEYTKIDKSDGQLKTYTSHLYSVPLRMSFDIKILVDTQISLFKIQQSIIETFYKNKTFKTTFRNQTIDCRVGIPENINHQRPIEYKLGTLQSDNMEISFNLEVETYMPMFDPTMESLKPIAPMKFGYETRFMSDDNSSEAIGSRNSDNSHYKSPNGDTSVSGYIKFITDYSNKVLPSGERIKLEWTWDKIDGDMRSVSIIYKDKKTNESGVIIPIQNHSYYDWVIPNDFTEFERNFFIEIHNDKVGIPIQREPKIIITPNPISRRINKESFIILDKGYFHSNGSATIPMSLSYIDKNGAVVKLEEVFTINIKNNGIDVENPITIKGNSILYKNDVQSRVIDLIVTDTQNQSNFAIMENVTIV